jgi:putative transposase
MGRAAGEGRRRRLPASGGRGGAAALDGGRRGGGDRRRPARTLGGAAQLPQRASRPHADARLGLLQLRIPKLRQGSYFPPFLEPRKTSEKALVAVVQEAWIGRVSTRRVDDLVQAMGLTGICKSQVSKLCKDIDERVGAFLDRPLEGQWPYLWLDATYSRQREGGRIVTVAVIVAMAVNTDGRREIIGLQVGPSDPETFWATFRKQLVKRGLKGVKLVVSDAHEGLKHAIGRALGSAWQRCRVGLLKKLDLRKIHPDLVCLAG